MDIENGQKPLLIPYFKFQTTRNGIALSYHFKLKNRLLKTLFFYDSSKIRLLISLINPGPS